jgi:hypothetical protein
MFATITHIPSLHKILSNTPRNHPAPPPTTPNITRHKTQQLGRSIRPLSGPVATLASITRSVSPITIILVPFARPLLKFLIKMMGHPTCKCNSRGGMPATLRELSLPDNTLRSFSAVFQGVFMTALYT